MRPGTWISPLLATFAVAGCNAPDDPDRVDLTNTSGKDDSASIRFKLTESNPVVGLGIGCDQPHGCEGSVIVKIKSPQGCAFFPTEPRCGIAPVGPLALDTANVTITSN